MDDIGRNHIPFPGKEETRSGNSAFRVKLLVTYQKSVYIEWLQGTIEVPLPVSPKQNGYKRERSKDKRQ